MATRKRSKKAVPKRNPKAKKKTANKKVVKKAVHRKAPRTAPRKARKVAPVPKGFHTLAPSLCFQDSAFAMQFYEKAFGAKEMFRLTEPAGRVGHAEMKIGDSHIMLSDEYPEMAVLSAKTLNGSPVRLNLTVKNADALFARAVAAGATVVRPVQDEFYGYRSGVVLDPFGYTWNIMSQIAVVSPKEMQKRWTKMLAAHKPEGSAG